MLNSILVYLSPDEAEFVPDDPNAPVSLVSLHVDGAAKCWTGRGEPRVGFHGRGWDPLLPREAADRRIGTGVASAAELTHITTGAGIRSFGVRRPSTR